MTHSTHLVLTYFVGPALQSNSMVNLVTLPSLPFTAHICTRS